MELGFEFQYPWALLLLALLPLYSWLRGRVGKAAALTYPDTSLLDGLGRPVREQSGRLRAFLRLLTAALLVIALAGPRTANKEIERETDGLDIMMVVDLSWSMMALDMSTPRAEVTRWQASQSVIYDFLSKRPDDRIGAVVFSGKPYLLSPLTINKIWVEKGIDRMHIGIVQETGTAIGEAVAMAVDKAILPVPSAELAAALGIRMYCIGLGKDEPTVLPRFDTRTGKLYRDVLGKTIPMQTINPANYEMLGKMAKVANGRFYRALDQNQLSRVYEEIDRLERTEVRIRESVVYENYRLIWAALAGVLLLLELGWGLLRPRSP